jgi:predicted metal-dependent phosphoesterase TrpH
MKFDLHMHTTRHSPDSQIDPFDLVRQAREIGLDGVVITEHDWLWTEAELEELRAAADGLVVLAGIEVGTREGHFLAYGVHDPFAFPIGIGVAEMCAEAHRQGGAVVAAHPFRWGQPFDDILRETQPALDGLEVMTNNMDSICRERAAAIKREYPLTGIGSSDAHQLQNLGVCYTEFARKIENSRDLVDAIRSGRAVAYDRRQQAG